FVRGVEAGCVQVGDFMLRESAQRFAKVGTLQNSCPVPTAPQIKLQSGHRRLQVSPVLALGRPDDFKFIRRFVDQRQELVDGHGGRRGGEECDLAPVYGLFALAAGRSPGGFAHAVPHVSSVGVGVGFGVGVGVGVGVGKVN